MRFTTVFNYNIGLMATFAKAGSFRRAADTDQFQLYGYGTGIGGLTLFYAGGNAYIGDYAKVELSDSAPVVFTAGDGYLLGSPNATVFPDPSDIPAWSNAAFAIPAASSSSNIVGFSNTTSGNSSIVTDSFTSYGAYIFVYGEAGDMESLWYAVPSGTRGIYALKWNSTNDKDKLKISLTLKKTPPSNNPLY